MKTRRTLTLATTLCTAWASQGQDWNRVPGGDVIIGNEYLGAALGSTVPLHLRTIPDLSIDFSTSNLLRARLYPVQTSTIGGFQNINQHGFLGLSGHANMLNNVGPFTRLHLADVSGAAIVNAQQFAFRPWQRNGVTFTGNADHGYVGQKYSGTDTTDMVILWSNDAGLGLFAPDHLTFRFATRHDSTRLSGAFSMEGLEAMRMFPLNDSSAFVGVGDFWRATVANGGNIVEPSERLDVLDRTIRIQRLIPDYQNDTLDQIVVADSTGRLHWRDISTISGADCDWVMQDQFPSSPPHVSNTYNGSACAWDRRHGVGIGVQLPKFKLHVLHNSDALLGPEAIYGEAMFNYNAGQWITGVHGRASTAQPGSPLLTMRAYGMRGEAFDARSSVGVYGLADITGAQGGGNATQTYGLMGRAVANGNSDHVVGVYGYGAGATDPLNDWAGWFEGRVNIQGGDLYINEVFAISDESLKTDIQDAPASGPVLDQLSVHAYQYNADAAPSMNLPVGQRVGLIAQEVESVMPHLVSEVTVPAKYDSLGAMIQEAYAYKAVNYLGLIPYLIDAVQELRAENAQIQQQLAACCASPNDDGTRSATSGATDEGSVTPAQERLLRIAPNPFTDRTTLYYTVERAGRAQLLVNSSDGRELIVLSEAQREAGEYQQVWSTEHLAPGVYHITLLLDGEPLVKRAVKVGR